MTTTPIVVYGNYLSQPSRAVLWALKMKGTPFTLKKINPMGGEADTTEYLTKFPTGFIPAIEHSDGTLVTEAPAILQYLAATNEGWGDIYPTITPNTPASEYGRIQSQQALLTQWMTWQQGSLRFATTDVFRPFMVARMKEMGVATRPPAGESATKTKRPPSPLDDPIIKASLAEKDARRVQHYWKDAMLTLTYGPLGHGSKYFLPGATSPTAADLLAYCELDQVYYSDMFDFGAYPQVDRWMARMREAPMHDDVHKTLFKFLHLNNTGHKTKPDTSTD